MNAGYNNFTSYFLFRRRHTWTDFYWLAHGLPLPFRRRSPPPHNFQIAKGMTHVVVSRDFVYFTVNDKKAIDLLNWMQFAHVPDELYFNTLHYNSDVGVPGSYKGKTLKTKYSMGRVI
jgi:hypothetical protein